MGVSNFILSGIHECLQFIPSEPIFFDVYSILTIEASFLIQSIRFLDSSPQFFPNKQLKIDHFCVDTNDTPSSAVEIASSIPHATPL